MEIKNINLVNFTAKPQAYSRDKSRFLEHSQDKVNLESLNYHSNGATFKGFWNIRRSPILRKLGFKPPAEKFLETYFNEDVPPDESVKQVITLLKKYFPRESTSISLPEISSQLGKKLENIRKNNMEGMGKSQKESLKSKMVNLVKGLFKYDSYLIFTDKPSASNQDLDNLEALEGKINECFESILNSKSPGILEKWL